MLAWYTTKISVRAELLPYGCSGMSSCARAYSHTAKHMSPGTRRRCLSGITGAGSVRAVASVHASSNAQQLFELYSAAALLSACSAAHAPAA